MDYSQLLREILHERDNEMNRLQHKLQQQEQVSKVHICYYILLKPPQALQYKALHAQVLSTTRHEFDKQSSDLKTLLQHRQDEANAAQCEFDKQTSDLRALLQHRQDEANALRNSLTVSCISRDA